MRVHLELEADVRDAPARAWRRASWAARVSLAAERRNFRRAGVLKNSARTVTVVPALAHGVGHPVEPAAGDGQLGAAARRRWWRA